MLNFPSALDIPNSTSSSVPAADVAPVVRETVTYRRPETRVTDIGKEPATWNWEDLRNYVVRRVEAIHGAFPREPVKEASIFRSFADRWGAQAGPIAQFAFEDCQGMWRGSPVRVTRFCKASDVYFAAPIVERLTT